MSRESPRFVPAGSLVEITARTITGRYLLVPSGELNAGILAVLGRALSMYPIDLHAVAFMSNHWHALATVADAQALSRFVQYVHSNVARLVQRLRGWDGSVFAKASYIVVGTTSEEARLRYVLSQGVKEGLVRRCVEWPGLQSARALLLEEVWVGRWQDRKRAHTIRGGGGRGGGREPLRGEIEKVYPIDFAPLPSWRGLDAAERQKRVKDIVNHIEADAKATYSTVSGASAILACDPWTKPVARKRSFAPRIHTVDQEERAQFVERYYEFSTRFLVARSQLRHGQLATIPGGCFPPIAPFCGSSTLIWARSSELIKLSQSSNTSRLHKVERNHRVARNASRPVRASSEHLQDCSRAEVSDSNESEQASSCYSNESIRATLQQ